MDNENSVITLVSDGEFDELFMGDAGVLAFDRIKNYLPRQIEVLKVGHHGAKNVVDKLMLDKIYPQTAIVSTGPNNYGHPNEITLNLLENHKIKIFRTDRHNSVKINENNGKYEVFTFDKASKKYQTKFIRR